MVKIAADCVKVPPFPARDVPLEVWPVVCVIATPAEQAGRPLVNLPPCSLHKSPNGINGDWRFSHAARFLQVPFLLRLEMAHWPDMRNVSGARQTEHWRLRGGAGGRAILASVGLGRVPGWQCWHSGRDGSSGDTIRVGIRQLEQC